MIDDFISRNSGARTLDAVAEKCLGMGAEHGGLWSCTHVYIKTLSLFFNSVSCLDFVIVAVV